MKRGPKPLQPAVRLLRGSRIRNGSPGADAGATPFEPANTSEESQAIFRSAPRWMNAAARRVWREVIQPHPLAAWQWEDAVAYCMGYVRWQEGLIQLQRDGDVLTYPSGAMYAHPLGKVVRELEKSLVELRTRLGLDHTPAAVSDGQEPSTPRRKERFFG